MKHLSRLLIAALVALPAQAIEIDDEIRIPELPGRSYTYRGEDLGRLFHDYMDLTRTRLREMSPATSCGDTGSAPPRSAACQRTYESFYERDEIDIRVGIGYFDLRSAGGTAELQYGEGLRRGNAPEGAPRDGGRHHGRDHQNLPSGELAPAVR